MNLKPFRDIDEHEVINLFSTVEADVSKGTFLQIVSFDPDLHNGPGASLPGTPAGTYSPSWEVYAKVKKAVSNTGVIGIALVDVVPIGSNVNVVTVQDQYRYFDKVPSGKAIPILKRGMVEINGFSGVPQPGLKGYINTGGSAQAGQLVVGAADRADNVGTFLSTSGADGYAVFQLNCI